MTQHEHREKPESRARLPQRLDRKRKGCGQCRMCYPDWFGMFLCATCGNKRCPHATDCRLVCTGSNEPGQPGSVYG